MKKYIIYSIAVVLSIISCAGDQSAPSTSGDSVLDDYSRLIAKDSSNAKLYVERGKYLYEQESYDAAIKDLKSAIKIDSLQPAFYSLLSDIYLDYYQSKNAIATLKLAEQTFPDHINTKLKLSEDYLIVKDYDNALINAHKVLNIDPNNAEAYFMIGLINKENGREEFAIKSFIKATELEPDLLDAWIVLGDLHHAKEDPRAIDYYNAALEVDRDNISALHSKAYYLQNVGKVDEAITIYNNIHRLDRQYEPAYLNSGILYLSIDSVQAAYDKFNILVNNNPTSAPGFYYRGIANELKGNSDLALEDYKTALKFDPQYEKAAKAIAAFN